MASDVVSTVFSADDGPFQAVARRVRQTMHGIGSFKPATDAFRALGTGLGGIEHGAKAAGTAVIGLKSAFAELLPIVGAIAGVTSIVAAFGKAIQQAGERETAAQRLSAVADAGENLIAVTERLEAASAKTGRDFPELAKSVQSFKEAGIPLEAAAGYTEKLNEISLVTGKDLEDLTDVFTRMSVKGEASFKDLAKFIAVPGVSQLAKEYKNLEVETGNLGRATAKQIELWKREDEAVNRTTAAINSFAQETGIAAAAFDAWKKSRETRVFDNSGIPGLGRVIDQQVAEFAEGMKQIEKETGLSELTIKQFIDAGRIGFASLINASQRYREERQKAREQEAQDTLRAKQEGLVAKQQGLVTQVQTLIEKGIDPKKLDAWFETFAGKWYQFAHKISETFEAFGTPLLNALKPLMDHLNSDLLPRMQDIAGKFGAWLSDEAVMFIKAFETGDWSKVGDQLKNALTTGFDAAIKAFRDMLLELFSGDNLTKMLAGAFQAFVGLAQAFGKAIARNVIEALAEATKNIPGIGGMFKSAAEAVDKMTSREEIAKSIDQAGQGFKAVSDKIIGAAQQATQQAETTPGAPAGGGAQQAETTPGAPAGGGAQQVFTGPGSRMFGGVIDVGSGLAPLPDTPEERRKRREFFPWPLPETTLPGGYIGTVKGLLQSGGASVQQPGEKPSALPSSQGSTMVDLMKQFVALGTDLNSNLEKVFSAA